MGETCPALPPLPGTFPPCQSPATVWSSQARLPRIPTALPPKAGNVAVSINQHGRLKIYHPCQALRSSVHGPTFCAWPAFSASKAFQCHANHKGLQHGALRKPNKNRLGWGILAAVMRSELSRMILVCLVLFWFLLLVIKRFL